MLAFGNILIFHPAAIGDAMLASPVAKTLKLNFPGAKITYWSHESLRQLIFGLSPSMDDFIDFGKDESIFALIKKIRAIKPDLFVDLSNSTKGLILSCFMSGRALQYIKHSVSDETMVHAVANFLETIAPVCEEIPKQLFPTIYPDSLTAQMLQIVFSGKESQKKPLIGIVPGVGRLRAHRAWIKDGWVYLLEAIHTRGTHQAVLIGGEDERDLCARINRESKLKSIDVAGKLSLPETAALLKYCDVVISGDTGPAHLAVAVGTPVIGLYGPTFANRSGPYGYEHLTLEQSQACQCLNARACSLTRLGEPGECMNRIMLPEILEKLNAALGERVR